MAYFHEQTITMRLIQSIEHLAPKVGMYTDNYVLQQLEYQELIELQDNLLAKYNERALTKNITVKKRS